MKLGVVGLGAIAPYFLRAIEADPALTLAAVCDLDPAKLAQHAERGVRVFTDHGALLAAGAVDALVICLPNDVHAAVATAALSRGVAVCCEKPLTITTDDAAAVVDTARRGGAVLFTAFHRRYNRHLGRLTAELPADPSMIASVLVRYHENIVEHTGGEAWYLDPRRCGGGCLIDNGPNALDEARFLLGDLSVTDATIGDVRSGAEFCAEVELVSAHGVPVRVELDWALPTGEVKDVVVQLRDGRVLRADLLAGFDGFKASLEHEYRGILVDFVDAVTRGGGYRDAGPHVVGLVAAAYAIARAKERRPRMVAKYEVASFVVKLLFHSRTDRAMTLSRWPSRCIPAGQIHELVTTTDRPRAAGDRVDRVGFLGFTQFAAPAVVERGDEVWFVPGAGGSRRIGQVAGFDECHWPNHYNILIDSEELLTAGDIDLRPGDEIRFLPAPTAENR